MSTAAPNSLPTDDPWRQAFVLRLRLLDVVGTSIGDALAVVETHCTESSETPLEAFGDPDDYAREVAAVLAPGDRVAPPRRWGSALLGGVSGLGIIALLNGASGLRAGTAELTTGDLAGMVMLALVGAAVPAMVGLIVEHRHGVLLFGGVWGAVAACMVLAQVLWTGVRVSMPAWLLLVTGVAIMVAVWVPSRGSGSEDPVIDPRSGRDKFPTPRWLCVIQYGSPVVLVVAAVLFAVRA